MDNINEIPVSLEEQQEQIYSLSNSLEQITKYIQYSQNQENSNQSEIANSIQELSNYILATASNMDILKNDIDILKEKLGIINENIIDGQQSKTLNSISNQQKQITQAFPRIAQTLNMQEKHLQSLSGWKFISIAIASVSLISISASFFTSKLIMNDFQDKLEKNDAALANGIQRIQKHLGL